MGRLCAPEVSLIDQSHLADKNVNTSVMLRCQTEQHIFNELPCAQIRSSMNLHLPLGYNKKIDLNFHSPLS